MKTDIDEKRKSYVQENPLNSGDALKIKKERSKQDSDGVWGGGQDSPTLKSLFDVKGNSKFKLGKTEEDKKKSISLLSESQSSEKDDK